MENTQQKINMALMAINYLSNTLNIVNTEMMIQPSQEVFGLSSQEAMGFEYNSFSKILIDLANDMRDYMNYIDIITHEDLYVIKPMFDLVNK